MADNVTILGDAADWFDNQYLEGEKFYDEWVMSFDPNGNWQYGAMTVASLALATGAVAKTFVDTLRVGNGASEGSAYGIFQDTLRVSVVAGPALKVIGSGIRMLPVVGRVIMVEQAVGHKSCAWISALNGIRKTNVGKRAMVTLEELLKAGKHTFEEDSKLGTTPEEFPHLVGALRKLGVPFREYISNHVTLQNLYNIVKLQGSGVMQVTLDFEVAEQYIGSHALLVQATKSGLRVIDNFGREYATISAYLDYLKATNIVPKVAQDVPLLFFPNSGLARLAHAAGSVRDALQPVGRLLSRAGGSMTTAAAILIPLAGVPDTTATLRLDGLSGRTRLSHDDFDLNSLNSRAGGRNTNPLCKTRCH